ncbi:hypothetical protein BIU90_02585 [Curtobacterium sp. MCBA15_001]|nr:hypothetical protein BIU90_02585 [Curtobacterium sp. MCBA15_001]
MVEAGRDRTFIFPAKSLEEQGAMDNVIGLFDQSLRAEGYRRKGRRWFVEKDEFRVAFYVLKSRFGAEYFVDIELTLHGSQDVDVSTRVDYWTGDVGLSFRADDPLLQTKISDFIEQQAMPLVRRLNADLLRSSEGAKILRIAYVSKKAYGFFEFEG